MAVRPLAVALPHVVELVAFLVSVPAVQIVAIGLPLVDGVVISAQSVTTFKPVVLANVHPDSAAGHEFGHALAEPSPPKHPA